jgi:hypothetical protein
MASAAEDIFGAARDYARQARGEGSAGEEPWGEPDRSILSPHREKAPGLPLSVFGPFWGRWLDQAAEAKGCAPDYVALPLLTAAGGLLANVRRARPWPGWSEPPVLNTANVGLPSSAKSPGADEVRDCLAFLEAEWNLNHDECMRRWRTAREEAEARRELWEKDVKLAVKEGLAPPVEPESAQPPPAPELRRLVLVNATTEAAARRAAANPRGLICFRDELAGWLAAMDKYGNAAGDDRAVWLEAYGGRPYIVDRVKDGDTPVRVPALAIGVTGGIQPDRLERLLLSGDDDGLAARFLYAWPERRAPRRPTAAPDDNAAVDALRRLRELPIGERHGEPAPVHLPFTEDAAALIQAWREQVAQMEQEAEGVYVSWLGKLPGMAARLALVLEHLWWCGDHSDEPPPEEVSERAVMAALAFLDGYAVAMARRVFADAALPRAERDATALARWLVRQDPAPAMVNARDLRRRGALPTKDAARYDAALAELAEAGWLRAAPSRVGLMPGRSRKDWAVNPSLTGASL